MKYDILRDWIASLRYNVHIQVYTHYQFLVQDLSSMRPLYAFLYYSLLGLNKRCELNFFYFLLNKINFVIIFSFLVT